MRTKHLSLPVKLNIGILAVFLVLSCLLLVFSNTLYRRTVYDPFVRKLEDPAQMYLQEIPSCLESLLQYVGTEELDSRRAPDEDGTYGG